MLFKSFLKLLASGFGAQLITLAALPVFARLFAPDTFGLFAQYTAVIWLFVVAGTLQLEHALITESSREEQLLLTIGISMAAGLLTGFGVLLYLCVIYLGIFQYHDEWLIALTSAGVISIHQACRMFIILKGNFNSLAASQLLNSMTMVGLTLVVNAIYDNPTSPMALLVGQLCGFLLSTALIIKKIIAENALGELKVRRIVEHWLHRVSVARFLLPVNLLKTVLNRFVILALGVLGLPLVAGYISMVDKIIGAPIQLVGNSVSAIVKNQIRELSESKSKFIFKRSNVVFFIFSFIALTGATILLIPHVIPVLLGHAWIEGAIFMQLWVIAIFANFIFLCFEDFLIYVRKVHLRLLINITTLCCCFFIALLYYIECLHSSVFLIVLFVMARVVFFAFDLIASLWSFYVHQNA